MSTRTAAWPLDLLTLHYYFKYCKKKHHPPHYFLMRSAIKLAHCPKCYVHSCLWGTTTWVFSLPAYTAFIISVCFDGNYHLWMQETWGEKTSLSLPWNTLQGFKFFWPDFHPRFLLQQGLLYSLFESCQGKACCLNLQSPIQLNNPPFQRKTFFRAFSSHICYCQPPK